MNVTEDIPVVAFLDVVQFLQPSLNSDLVCLNHRDLLHMLIQLRFKLEFGSLNL